MTPVRQSSYERLLRLAHQRVIDGKGGLAASVAKLCLDARADLTVRELALVFDILRKLMDQIEVQVRRQVADYLAERNDVPKDLIDYLANDSINVAYPILVHSVLLSEDDLIEIIDRQGQAHRIAIAKRPEIGEAVTEKLVRTDDAAVILAAVQNLTAHFSQPVMSHLVDRSYEEAALREPLARRPDLGTKLARRLYIWVGDSLKSHLAAHHDIDQKSLDEMVDKAVDDAFGNDPLGGLDEAAPTPRAAPPPVDPLAYWKSAQREPLVAAVEAGGREAVIDAFMNLTRLPRSTAETVFDPRTPETVAIACKAVGVARDDFIDILVGIMEPDQAAAFEARGQLRRVLGYFDRIEIGGANTVLQRWRANPKTPRG